MRSYEHPIGTRQGFIVAVSLLLVGLPGNGWSADHGDGPIGFDVIQSLLEGPTYPTAPVALDLFLRQPSPPMLSAGDMELSILSAQSDSGEDLAVIGTLVDNGDPYGEPGDEAAADIRGFETTAPSSYPQGSHYAAVAHFHNNENVTEWEIRFWKPSRPGQEQSYYTVDLAPRGPSGEELGVVQLLIMLQVGLGQNLRFENLGITAPVTSGPDTEIQLSFDLNQTGGVVDTAEPIFTLTLTTGTPIPAASWPYGPVAIGLLLLASVPFALRLRLRH